MKDIKQGQCFRLDCQCDCELTHDKCRQTACSWRIEKLLKLES